MQAKRRSPLLLLVPAAMLASTLSAGDGRAASTATSEAYARLEWAGFSIAVTPGLTFTSETTQRVQYGGVTDDPDGLVWSSTYDPGYLLGTGGFVWKDASSDGGSRAMSQANAFPGPGAWFSGYSGTDVTKDVAFSGTGTATFTLPYEVHTNAYAGPGETAKAQAKIWLQLSSSSGSPGYDELLSWMDGWAGGENEGLQTGNLTFAVAIDGGGSFTLAGSALTQAWAEASPVPEPATMLLLGSGLAGVAGLRRRRQT